MNRLYRKQDRLEAKLTGKYRVARPKGHARGYVLADQIEI